ncbi:hypothetical protein E2320_000270 [Naja naja]|nr:hypothetical protein E2320_000270 [Naja naja]
MASRGSSEKGEGGTETRALFPSQTTTRACSGKCPLALSLGAHCGRLATILEEVRVLSLHVLVQIRGSSSADMPRAGGESGHSTTLPLAAVWRDSRGGAHGHKGDGKSSALFCLFPLFCFSVLEPLAAALYTLENLGSLLI